MINENNVKVALIIVSILLTVFILLQNRGNIGNGGELFKTRKGIEHWLDVVTVLLVILFGVLSIFALVL